MGANIILDSLNSDFSFVMEVGALLSCFLYFWFQLISLSFNKIEKKRTTVPRLGRLYVGVRSGINRPLERFHLINEKLRVGSTISKESSLRKTA